ncbi:MAG: general stress protein [Carnobacterium sp.]|uniref:General stress protein n=1 Tax=Carnobacterium antarcticum TaxID=2126436 RepID=A0ABW4NJX0_9LACT|nr:MULTISPECIES: general stress protein [unclassified Carnobacterium]ALV22364.1 hypothetical protein NY10_1766 [Carnobacterium sp. CP1]QQP70300.1 general stress protein [Carnobacterium sp. CS13]
MSMMVKGIYDNAQETLEAVNQLKSEGYTANEITVVTGQNKNPNLKDLNEAKVSTADATKEDHEDEESVWEKIKDVFTVKDYEKGNSVGNPLAEYGVSDDVASDLDYKNELEKGRILIVVDDAKEMQKNSPEKKPLI